MDNVNESVFYYFITLIDKLIEKRNDLISKMSNESVRSRISGMNPFRFNDNDKKTKEINDWLRKTKMQADEISRVKLHPAKTYDRLEQLTTFNTEQNQIRELMYKQELAKLAELELTPELSELAAELGTEFGTELGTELGTEFETELGTEFEPEFGTEFETESEFGTEFEPELKPELEPELKPKRRATKYNKEGGKKRKNKTQNKRRKLSSTLKRHKKKLRKRTKQSVGL
jgi:hypothetical protein